MGKDSRLVDNAGVITHLQALTQFVDKICKILTGAELAVPLALLVALVNASCNPETIHIVVNLSSVAPALCCVKKKMR